MQNKDLFSDFYQRFDEEYAIFGYRRYEIWDVRLSKKNYKKILKGESVKAEALHQKDKKTFIPLKRLDSFVFACMVDGEVKLINFFYGTRGANKRYVEEKSTPKLLITSSGICESWRRLTLILGSAICNKDHKVYFFENNGQNFNGITSQTPDGSTIIFSQHPFYYSWQSYNRYQLVTYNKEYTMVRDIDDLNSEFSPDECILKFVDSELERKVVSVIEIAKNIDQKLNAKLKYLQKKKEKIQREIDDLISKREIVQSEIDGASMSVFYESCIEKLDFVK